jgi:hypothetical protein
MSARPFPRAISMSCRRVFRRVSGLFRHDPTAGAREKGERLRLGGWSHTRTAQNFYITVHVLSAAFFRIPYPARARGPPTKAPSPRPPHVMCSPDADARRSYVRRKEDQRSEPATHSNISSRAVEAISRFTDSTYGERRPYGKAGGRACSISLNYGRDQSMA